MLPRGHQQFFDQGRNGTPVELMITETRGQYGPLPLTDKHNSSRGPGEKSSPCTATRPCSTTIRSNHFLEVTWREPGGIELTVHPKKDLGRRQLLAIAEGLRQP